MSTEARARELFASAYPCIRQIIGYVARRHRLDEEECAEFSSYVTLKLVEKDYARLRKFRGASSLRTYLTTVVQRLFLDYRTERWGKWRPSAKARRLGETAVALERLMSRDGFDFAAAAEHLASRGTVSVTRDELWELAEALPARRPRTFVGLGELAASVGSMPASASDPLERRERGELAARVGKLLEGLVEDLSEIDRLILKLRFLDGFTVQLIADTLKLRQKPLYQRIQRLLAKMRERLDRSGLRRQDMIELVDSGGLEIDLTHIFVEPKPSTTSVYS